MKPTILFISDPDKRSETLNSKQFQDHYNCLHHELTTKDSLLKFLKEHSQDNIVAIYGGYPAFLPIGGLTREIIYSEWFPRETLKCLVLCSRGYDGLDLDALRANGIRLYNFQDAVCELESGKDQGGNDVADCVLWHVLEGFRKFSFQQKILRESGHTTRARALASKKPVDKWQFGHELSDNGSLMVQSPRGKKCLVLGLGSVGKQIAYKLQHGLGLEIHYCKRTEPTENVNGWQFHRLDDTLKPKLFQFSVIVIALPGTKHTQHLIDKEFLSHCNGPNLILINAGRGTILNLTDVKDALKHGQLRHLGADVFYREPLVDEAFLQQDKMTSLTPHIGSSTEEVFYQSCELALHNIIQATSDKDDDSPVSCASRVI